MSRGRVLVVGGAGYVGSVSVEALVSGGYTAVVLDDLSTGHRAAVQDPARLVVGPYGDPEAVRDLLEVERIDAVMHCAARSLVGESIDDPARYYRENVAGGISLLEGVRLAGVRRFVFSSTAAVYGTPDLVPIPEDAALEPINPYGESKRAFESALRWYSRYGIRSVILRYFNVAGATERNGEQHAPETHLIPTALAAVEGSGPPLTLFGDDYPTSDGTPIRDYIHVADLADAHLLAIEHIARMPAEGEAVDAGASSVVCNLGSGTGFSVREVVSAVERVTGQRLPHHVGPRRPGDPPVLVASTRRAEEVLGWRPRRSDLAAMIAAAWSWRGRHPEGYQD